MEKNKINHQRITYTGGPSIGSQRISIRMYPTRGHACFTHTFDKPSTPDITQKRDATIVHCKYIMGKRIFPEKQIIPAFPENPSSMHTQFMNLFSCI